MTQSSRGRLDDAICGHLSAAGGRPSRPGWDPWIVAYGDSLTRGVFFNLVELLNSTDPLATHIHAGHSANYSLGCARVQTRPPLNRSKCAAFEYTMRLDAGAGGAVVPLSQAGGRRSHPPSGADGELLLSAPSSRRGELQLSFSLKTFGWEPAFDEDWLRALRSARRRPDAIVVGFGLWDMLYPPANDPTRGVDHFRAALARFARELRAALGDGRRSGPVGTASTRGTSSSAFPRGTRVYWLTLPAIAASRLPAWKRGRMSDEYARAYNAALAAEFSSSTWRVVDTYRATLSHGAEDTADGIHYGRASLDYTRQLLADLCRDETRDVPDGGRSLGVRGRRVARSRTPIPDSRLNLPGRRAANSRTDARPSEAAPPLEAGREEWRRRAPRRLGTAGARRQQSCDRAHSRRVIRSRRSTSSSCGTRRALSRARPRRCGPPL